MSSKSTAKNLYILRAVQRMGVCFVFAIVSCAMSLPVRAATNDATPSSFDKAQKLFNDGKFSEAVDALVKECDENPANEAARILLAQAYERAGSVEKADHTWRDVLDFSRDEESLQLARKSLSRIRRIQIDKSDTTEAEKGEGRVDPFKIPMPDVDWTGLEIIEDSKYLPPRYPQPVNFELPPFVNETKHFTVYSANERLSKVVGERAEIYLDFMTEKLFGGRAWAVRFPILVYTSIEDYNKHGGPVGSGGVTYGHPTGKTQAVILFQLKPDFRQSKNRGGGGGGSDKGVWKYGIESVLPHELTHAMMNEFFGGQTIPRWMNEAIAGRFEQTRDHYGQAARLARQVIAGEYFRMRDLFDQKVYPQRIELFYEQSATVVLYLFEAGPESMHAFLTELAAGHGHDAACAAALGIPEEGAVEEFERRWVEWMRRRYVKDLDITKDKTVESSADKTNNSLSLPWVNEVDTVSSLTNWRDVDTSSLAGFKVLGDNSDSAWSVKSGILSSTAQPGQGASLLGIRMNESAPVAVTCEVSFLGSPGEPHRFGFAQVDAGGFDTRIEATAPLRDTSSHKVIAIWTDDLAIYVDDVCQGRYAAQTIKGNAQDVDYPLALVSYGPVEVKNLRVASINAFSSKPVVAANDGKSSDQPATQEGARSSRRRGQDSKGP